MAKGPLAAQSQQISSPPTSGAKRPSYMRNGAVSTSILFTAPFLVAGAATVLGAWLLGGGILAYSSSIPGPIGPLRIRGDSLSGVFVLLVGLLGLASALAAPAHSRDRGEPFLFLVFLLGLVLVPLAGDVFTLMLAWEAMSLAPGLLLALSPDRPTRAAGLLYLAYAQVSAALLLLGLLAASGGTDGSIGALAMVRIPPVALLLILLGAAIKAGLMPFHAWLPEAHPAAPGHVSALMSGAMVALPAYVLLRIVAPHDVAPGVSSLLVLGGAVSAALGSLYALQAGDLKRVLALTTVAHMGALFSLLGLVFLTHGRAPGELEAFLASAGLAYLFTHGLGKGALFLVAGEVDHAVHELDLDRLGGLWRKLPGLSFLAFLAGLSLAALPPLAGFTSEVALLTGFFASLRHAGLPMGVGVLGAIFLLALAAGAGLAAVGKAVLGAFHGPSRSEAEPQPVPVWALVGPGLLVGTSLAIGFAPGFLWARLPTSAAKVLELPTPAGGVPAWPLLLVGLGVAGLLMTWVRGFLPQPQFVDAWSCGAPPPTRRQTYTPQGLGMPYRILFAEILRPGSDLSLQEAPVVPFAPSKGRYHDPAPSFIEPWLHRPLRRTVGPLVEFLRSLHRASIHTYLVYVLVLLVGLLFALEMTR